jgi:hypothetical protein
MGVINSSPEHPGSTQENVSSPPSSSVCPVTMKTNRKSIMQIYNEKGIERKQHHDSHESNSEPRIVFQELVEKLPLNKKEMTLKVN